MQTNLEELIKYHTENHLLDFKKVQYPIDKHPKKHEILKDFIAFVNNPDDSDKFILIGIIEENGSASQFNDIIDMNDDANYQQYIIENIEPKINFEYRNFDYQGFKLCYFRLYNNSNRPYLFKKDIQNSSPSINKTEFRKGSGFIRIGSSTKQLSRIEFDEIYEKKHQKPDRKKDLKIRAYSRKFFDYEIDKRDLKYIDIDIENISNKSIEFDVEMTIIKTDGIDFITAFDLKREIDEKKQKNSTFGMLIKPIINPMLLDIELINTNPAIVRRTKLRSEKNAISLQQNSKESDIFFKELILLNSPDIKSLDAEIIIRSDDFTQGILKKTVSISV